MSYMKTRKPSKLYTFQNTLANHLLGVRMIYCTMRKYSFLPEPHWKKSTIETIFQWIMLDFIYVWMIHTYEKSHSWGSQRRAEGEKSRCDNSPLAAHHSFLAVPVFFPLNLPVFSGPLQLPPCPHFVSLGDQSCSRTWSPTWSHWWAKDCEDLLLGRSEMARAIILIGKSTENLISQGALYVEGNTKEHTFLAVWGQGYTCTSSPAPLTECGHLLRIHGK